MSMRKMTAIAALAMAAAAFTAPALASNPFSDVPKDHWAYDAVETLAAKGIIEGYPGDTFQGSRQMTRYEIATMLAKAIDSDTTDGSDLETLKALVVEFGPELEAIGVKTDGIENRISRLEGNMKGWVINGEMRYDLGLLRDGEGTGTTNNGWTLDRARVHLRKNLDHGLTFIARWHIDTFDRYYLNMKDAFNVNDLTVKIGMFDLNWEPKDKISGDLDQTFMDCAYRGVDVSYQMGNLYAEGFWASDRGNYNTGNYSQGAYEPTEGNKMYGLRLKYTVNENLWVSGNALWAGGTEAVSDEDYDTYWAAIGIRLLPGAWLRGAYFWQDLDPDYVEAKGYSATNPTSWRVILDLDEKLLKFTKLWLEYNFVESGFTIQNNAWGYAGNVFTRTALLNYLSKGASDMDVYLAKAEQKLSEKWLLKERYLRLDTHEGSANEWGVAVRYYYTPQFWFELAFMDYHGRLTSAGKVEPGYRNYLIRLRTWIYI